MAGTQPSSQIIGGQSYAPYSPEWYAAQNQDVIRRTGVAGTAAGTGEANYLAKVSPSLAGLYAATGVGGDSGSGGGVGAPPVASDTLTRGGAPTPSGPASIAPVDFSKANTAAFATAKDQAAQTADASMRGLSGALAARGLGGAGYEAGQIGNTLSREANTIGAAGRDEARNEAALSAQASGENLSAGVTQRGQDIGAQEAEANRESQARSEAYSGAITQREQDIQQQESAAELAQQKAALKASQSLAILKSVLGGGAPQGPPDYVY